MIVSKMFRMLKLRDNIGTKEIRNDSWLQPMSSPIKWLVVILCGWLVFWAVGEVISERARRAKEIDAENESVHALAQATSKAEMSEAVGELGILLTLKDGSWIAIRSRCNRSHPLWGSSVALDSEGNWLQSNNYLSGIFMTYRRVKNGTLSIGGADREHWLAEFCPEVHAIATAANLRAAHQAMDVLGLTLFNPDAQPAFRDK